MAGNGAGTGTALPCSPSRRSHVQQPGLRLAACVRAGGDGARQNILHVAVLRAPREMDPEVQQPIASQWQRSGLINTAALQEARAAAILLSLEIIPFTTSSVAFAAS